MRSPWRCHSPGESLRESEQINSEKFTAPERQQAWANDFNEPTFIAIQEHNFYRRFCWKIKCWTINKSVVLQSFCFCVSMALVRMLCHVQSWTHQRLNCHVIIYDVFAQTGNQSMKSVIATHVVRLWSCRSWINLCYFIPEFCKILQKLKIKF